CVTNRAVASTRHAYASAGSRSTARRACAAASVQLFSSASSPASSRHGAAEPGQASTAAVSRCRAVPLSSGAAATASSTAAQPDCLTAESDLDSAVEDGDPPPPSADAAGF